MTRLSAFLITRNEARDLPGCLESLQGLADDIVVVDDRSDDATLEITRRYGARTFSRALDGFASQKQFALDQATGEWALSIDADERVTPELAKEIQQIVAPAIRRPGPSSSPATAGARPTTCRADENGIDPQDSGSRRNDRMPVAYEIRRRFYFLGRPLRYGGLGRDWVLRLFRRKKGRFLNVRVHERIEVDGAVGRLQASLEHFSYATLAEYVDKSNHYTSLAAQDLWQRGRRFSWTDYLRPGWELISRLLLKGAWLDGHAGMLYAALSAHTAWLRAIKLWEMEHEKPLTLLTGVRGK